MRHTDWAYMRKHAWRFQGGERWTREMGPIKVFVAQSNATGFPRLLGIGLCLLAGAIYDHISGPLLMRGMRGNHTGLDAHPLSLTRFAWKASGWTNSLRWWLHKHATHFARYNRS